MKPSDCEKFYRDGRHYDLKTRNIVDDIPFYMSQIARFGDPVLELAAGTGRISIPLADYGVRITALDISESMLAHGRKKADEKGVNIEWIKADCRKFNLDRKFNFIFLPFNSIAHLHDLESLEGCFGCVGKHLTEKGRFVIDIFNPRLDILIRDRSRRYPVAQYPDPDGGSTVVITENNIYDAAFQINKIKWYYSIGGEEDKFAHDVNMRIFYPQELDALLHYNGFVIESKFGDYDESPFESSSPKQLIVCRRR
jgi:SAM-dependent methyltransferase